MRAILQSHNNYHKSLQFKNRAHNDAHFGKYLYMIKIKALPNKYWRLTMTVNKSPITPYDEDILFKTIEIMEKESNKLKSFIKSKTNPDLKLYDELDCEFDEIISKLEYLKLSKERRYFLSIKRMILHIVLKNSSDKDFRHCNFAVELLDFFIEMIKTNVNFYQNPAAVNEYERKYRDYRRFYYTNIYIEEYSDEEIYKILKGLNG